MADIREQDLALKTTIADTDWMRLVTPTGNHRMTVGQFKDLIGYTQLQSDVASLVDSGSNANGSYIRFSDGTQICYHDVLTVYATNRILQTTWTYPAVFVSAPSLIATPSGGIGIDIDYETISRAGPGALNSTIRLTAGGVLRFESGFNRNVYVVAIGRWK